ncbi:hypothetical protein NQ315_014463 [Exocentrus adspersus]|uniref:Uncharacterized protein n=1 Tax=Exocentrus adspersus TaxID=1586481 RepID=A0AAV8VE92_9CUCU|nr:hypothetical protein NQ315_014463 [Exocentrus adspersus]
MFIHRSAIADLPFARSDEMFIHRSAIADLPFASDEMFIHRSAIADLPFAWSAEMFIHRSAIADLPFAWSDEMFILWSAIADLPFAWSDEMNALSILCPLVAGPLSLFVVVPVRSHSENPSNVLPQKAPSSYSFVTKNNVSFSLLVSKMRAEVWENGKFY